VAGTLGRPELVKAANDAFIHAMHTAALVGAGIVLVGAIVLVLAFRIPTPSQSPDQPADEREAAGTGRL
jgi:hypothetical protein